MKTQQTEPAGFRCKNCGERMKVSRTKGAIRYRRCVGCGHRMTTRETAIGEALPAARSISGTLADLVVRQLAESLGVVLPDRDRISTANDNPSRDE